MATTTQSPSPGRLPAFSAWPLSTGKRLIFTSHRDGGIGLYTMNVDGTDVRKVKHRRGYAGGAFFSPDGQWIVYRAAFPKTDEEKAEFERLLAERLLGPGNLEIYLARPDGSEERQLTNNGASNWAPKTLSSCTSPWFPSSPLPANSKPSPRSTA